MHGKNWSLMLDRLLVRNVRSVTKINIFSDIIAAVKSLIMYITVSMLHVLFFFVVLFQLGDVPANDKSATQVCRKAVAVNNGKLVPSTKTWIQFFSEEREEERIPSINNLKKCLNKFYKFFFRSLNLKKRKATDEWFIKFWYIFELNATLCRPF